MSNQKTLKGTTKPTSLQESGGSLSVLPEPKSQQMSLFTQGDFPVKTSPLPEKGRAWLEAGADSTLSSTDLLQQIIQSGLFWKTSQAFSVPMSGKTLQSSLEGLPESFLAFLKRAGEMQGYSEGQSIKWHTGFSIRNISEFPSDADVCSLSAILVHENDSWAKRTFKTIREFQDWLRKYYLSAKAAFGILRRAEKRGKTLPTHLEQTLRTVATRGMEE